MKNLLLLALLVIASGLSLQAQQTFPYQNPDLPIDQRVDDLVSRMTVQEKIDQLLYESPAIDRLGVPKYNWWNECLHGVARAGYATVFPQSISIAASWDQDLIFDVASVISDEARAKHHEFVRRGERGIYQGLTFWSPNINIFRDPRWGRGHETYGEDPYLTGQMGMEFVRGLQGDDDKYLKVVATAKHYAVHSGPEPLRHEFDARVSERDLQETYLPAFRTLVVDGGVYSVMGAYNRFRGEACCANTELFDILRNKWNFDGYFVSDCGAIADIWEYHKVVPDAASAAALAVKEGCDLNCGSTYNSLKEAVEKGLITEDELDVSVKRLFTARFKLGMFDPVENVPYAQIPFSVNNNPAHNVLARQAARESIVLLKNEDHTLPFSKEIKTVAVIGPNADDIESLWGNYSGVPSDPVTVLKGIQNKLSPQAKVLYAQGCDLADGIPEMKAVPSIYLETADGEQGLKAEYFANSKWEGDPLYKQVDDNIDFCWDIDTPDPRLAPGSYSIRWTGYLVAPKSGTYYFSDWGKPFMTIKIGDEEKGGNNEHHPRMRELKVDLKAGEKYKVEVKYQNYYGDATARMLWSVPQEDRLQQAVETASQADVVVLALGLNERLEGEEMKIQIDGFSGGDRTSLDLPATQVELMKAIVATGKPVALVLINGSALSVNWAADNVPAILTAGYPGQQGGNAIADVLFGDYNPAGRLPVTYYKSVDQLPPFEDYNMDGRTYRYFTQEPLYPFGFGLSYTKFSYSNLQISPNILMGDKVAVSVDVTNTGDLDGDEVVQLYLTDEKASTPRPIRQLEGFKRVNLKKGETKTINFSLDPRQLSMINSKDLRVVEPGWFTVSVGGEQPGFSGRTEAATTNTVSGRFVVKGKAIVLEE
ncbi:glycoside hydrolase family 3 C-terminal domain-containing protein [Mangrovibacterium diazotrophicum]|uniref:Beta-glucosidase n=1 Tax=Mangrovibacterium diazotrophicum TaxID=1261403 RepID=A0A419W5M6_9BACT|nr:glycoside hydrolase family 3 C-terminal domain-containing protein [Mangrovibacterium diazotrophicum]RKD90745.1 beta-glucosidase [Mangrovibacterium diazotrophicum]